MASNEELREQLIRAQAQLDLLKSQQQQQQGTNHTTMIVQPNVLVGIRNISSHTVGIASPTFGEPELLNLAAAHPGGSDEGTTGTMELRHWSRIRRELKLVGNGLIMRDDSVLGPTLQLAPPDEPNDLHPDFAKNAVIDPQQWIESRTEDELSRDIAAMTSEASLHRLSAFVTYRIWQIGEEFFKDDAERGKKAVNKLPSKYSKADDQVSARLDELRPGAKKRHEESKTIARF